MTSKFFTLLLVLCASIHAMTSEKVCVDVKVPCSHMLSLYKNEVDQITEHTWDSPAPPVSIQDLDNVKTLQAWI